MDLPEQILGKGIATTLRERGKRPLVSVGSDHFYRRDFAKVECWCPNATTNLGRILAEHLNIPNLRHLYFHVPPSSLALPRLGAVSLAVLGAMFELRGLGGDEPLMNYMRQHSHTNNGHKVDDLITTFAALKHREAKELQQEKQRRRSRKHARRNKAHELRLARRTDLRATG